jgi:hypothetical protein
MNLYEFIGKPTHPLYGLEVTVTSTGFKYITREAYNTESLTQYWSALRQDGSQIKQGAPALDSTPLWTTDTLSVFEDPNAKEITIDFNGIKDLADFSDHSLYTIYAPYQSVSILGNVVYTDLAGSPDEDDLSNIQVNIPGLSDDRRLKLPLSNVYALTKSNKMNPFDFLWHHTHNVPRMISIVVPFATSDFSDWSLMFKMAAPGLLKIKSGQTTQVFPGVGKNDLPSYYPSVVFEKETATVTADGVVSVNFKLVDSKGNDITDHNADVYLETNAGMLNKQKVTTTGGKGSVKFIASHLTAGDTAKIKCGFKYFTGTDDCIVTVQ